MTNHDGPGALGVSTDLPDLAARALGGSVIYANDDLFADKANLIMPGPVRGGDEFGLRGKVYDGWETRRRRTELGGVPSIGAAVDGGAVGGVPAGDVTVDALRDEAIVRLGAPGSIAAVVVDTAFFRGNYPPHISIEATSLEGYPSVAEVRAAPWVTLVAKAPALGDHENRYHVDDSRRWTHVRLALHPDGGVARLRVHGRAIPDPRGLTGTVDLAAVENGGVVEGCSNMFYSSPSNVLRPGRAANPGEGWETARRRDDGNDWLSMRLGAIGVPREIEIDTSTFVGNAPAAATVSGRREGGAWHPVLDRVRLQPDTPHRFRPADLAPIDEVRVDIFPDGGLARFRVRGELTREGMHDALARWWRALPDWHREEIGVPLGISAAPDRAGTPDEAAVIASLGSALGLLS